MADDDISCPACDEAQALDLKGNLSLCIVCGHLWQSDRQITTVYDGHYAHQYDTKPVRRMSDIRWNFIQSNLSLPLQSKVLDIGYGNGAFLKCAQAAGMTIYGIDVHQENFGIPTIDFDTDIKFDLICFFDSIEHFVDFDKILDLDAKFVIVSLPYRPRNLLQSPSAWRHFKPGEHLHYFSEDSLKRLMDRWGFPNRVCCGFPEDFLRGKILLKGRWLGNIYTSIFSAT